MSFPPVPVGATVAVDIESYNRDLKGTGPQFLFSGPDFVIGIGIFVSETGEGAYFPIAHDEGNSELRVVDWFRELLARDDITAVFANAKFDLEGLCALGIAVKCRIVDVQVTEALINENEWSYSLSSIAKRRGLGDKSSGEIEATLLDKGLVIPGGRGESKPDWSRLRALSPQIVGPYCVTDAKLTARIHLQQLEEIRDLGLQTVYDLECKLISILFDIHLKGIAVDIPKASQANDSLLADNKLEMARVQKEVGAFDIFSSDSISEVCYTLGFIPPKAEKSKRKGTEELRDSVTGDWLRSTKHPHLMAIAELRKSIKIQRDFILGTVLRKSYNGRIHPTFYSTRGSSFMSGDDTNGTKSGRLACTNPNLQQIPSRHPVLGPLTRSLFLPNNGDLFLKSDYQAQEIRVALHYASKLNLSGSKELIDHYNDNPLFDYHEYVRSMIEKHGVHVSRSLAKTAGLAIMYGIGRKKLSTYLEMPIASVDEFLAAFHSSIPWVKEALVFTSRIAEKRGYVKTILGRIRHFNRWEKKDYTTDWQIPMDNEEAARLKWGNIRRADTFKAFNSVVQGTSAEQAKMALVACHEEGLEVLLSVHDELCLSVNNHTQAEHVKEIMENILPLHVPTVAEAGLGPNWASCKEKL